MNENLASRLRHIAGLVERYPDEIPDEWFNSAIKRVEALVAPDPIDSMIRIAQVVADGMGVAFLDLTTRGRTQHIVLIRRIAWYIVRQLTPISFPNIGDYFHSDHSSVIQGVKVIVKRTNESAPFKATVETLIERCRAEISSIGQADSSGLASDVSANSLKTVEDAVALPKVAKLARRDKVAVRVILAKGERNGVVPM